jgi:hypothetical protein
MQSLRTSPESKEAASAASTKLGTVAWEISEQQVSYIAEDLR